MNNIPEEVRQARKQYRIIQIHCPHLDENLNPKPELCVDQVCPKSNDEEFGKCFECQSFMGLFVPDGEIFAHMTFEGYCDQK